MAFSRLRMSPATVAASIERASPPWSNQPSKGREKEPWLAFTPACRAERESISTRPAPPWPLAAWRSRPKAAPAAPGVAPISNQSGPTDTLAPRPAWPVGTTPKARAVASEWRKFWSTPPSTRLSRRVGVPSPSKLEAPMLPGLRPLSAIERKGTARLWPRELRLLRLTPSSTARALNRLLNAPIRSRKASGLNTQV